MDKINKKNLIIILVSLFIILSIVIVIIFNNQKNTKIETFKSNNIIQLDMDYNAIYNEHFKIARILFDSEINTKEIINKFKLAHKSSNYEKDIIRKDLYKTLKSKYTILKKYDLKQLHFHLPNNDSFLRMHRPNKFGDNLTGIRDTVAYVNKYKKFIDGFEEGRIFNGYRFVFPLFDENKTHIGSVEISFSTLALTQNLSKNFNITSNFLILKEVVDTKVFDLEKSNYLKSRFDNFYFEKNILKSIKTKKHFENKEKLNKIEKRLLKGEKFTVFDDRFNDIVSFIPVLNPITKKSVAYLVLRQGNSYIPETIKNFYILVLGNILLLALVLFIIFKAIVSKKELEDTIKKEVEKNREIEKQLFQQSKQAQMGDMIGNIAHQWRQPLSVISTSASGIQVEIDFNGVNEQKIYKAMDDIIKSANFLSNTIDTFRNFIISEDKPVDVILQNRIDESLEIVESSLKNNYIELKKDIDYDDPIHTTLIAGELSQVLINILNNAKDAIKEKDIEEKWIKISLKKVNDNGVISIEDNGGGIPEDIMDKIFDPYFTTKHKSQGTGLGLHMSYDIVTKHFNGKLYADNKKNGAVFFIEIPITIE